MADGDVIYLGWNDLVGITRVRGVPAGEISKRMAYGFRDDHYFFLKIRAAFPGIR